MTQHVACDGRGIANDDIKEIEMIRRRDEIRQELFQNAARVRKAMRSNAWLRPVFRKYKEACREILHQKKQEAEHFTTLCDYCDIHNDNDVNADPEMKLIREELKDIHAQLETMYGNDDYNDDDDDYSSSSSSEMSDDSENGDNEDNEANKDNEDNQSVSSQSSSSSSSSSSSASSLKKRMEDFL